MRYLITFFYCAVVTIAIAVFFWKNPALTYVAKSNIEENQLLSPSDLKIERNNSSLSPVGTYAKKSFAKGEIVKFEDFSNFPDMQMTAGFITVLFNLDKKFIETGRVNPGSKVIICKGAKRLTDPPIPAPNIKTVVCKVGTSPECIAMVDVPIAVTDTLFKAIKDAFGSTPLPTVRPLSTNCE